MVQYEKKEVMQKEKKNILHFFKNHYRGPRLNLLITRTT